MNNFVQPVKINLIDIFKNNDYIVPIYQRNYAWKFQQIAQLIDDIFDSKIEYFIGNIVVDRIDNNVYSVIDGQQRLTTIYLLFCFLNNNGCCLHVSKNSMRFEIRKGSNTTLEKIFSNNLEYENDNSEELMTGYKNIENYFKERKINKEDFIKKFDKIFLIMTQVPKDIDLNHYFEIMNTRGEQLELHEIAKGRLLSKISNIQERAIASKLWDKSSNMSRYIQMSFKPNIRELIFGDTWNNFKCENFDSLKNFFNEPDDYCYNLEDIINHEIDDLKYIDNDEETDDEDERFESIIDFPNFILLFNESQKNEENDDNIDDKNFLSLLESNWETEEKAKKFIFELFQARFFFDKYIIKRYYKDYKDEGRWYLQPLQSNDKKPQQQTLPNNNSQLRVLESALRITYTSPKTMHWISLILKTVRMEPSSDLIETLEKYAINQISKVDYKNISGFDVPRIMFTYLDYILIRDKKTQKDVFAVDSFQFQYRTSIEHFYPQNPSEGIKWEKDLNNFGNLALLTISGNSKFSNAPPSAKKAYTTIINQSPKLYLMSKYDDWTENNAEKHKQEMIEILETEIRRYQND